MNASRLAVIQAHAGIGLGTQALAVDQDRKGNAYSVATAGNTTYLRGFEVIGKRYWAQTNSRYGQLTFFTGLASDGEAWVGYTRRVGWTTINRFSSSGGSSAKFTCSRISGC